MNQTKTVPYNKKQNKPGKQKIPLSIRHSDSVTSTLRPKLKVGQPNDKYEQEADRVAERVMRMPEPLSSNSDGALTGINNTQPANSKIQRLCTSCAPDEKLVQTKTDKTVLPEVTPALTSSIKSLHAGGQSLSKTDRAFFEPRFAENFSTVKIHSNSQAANTARSINARAFTLGNNIVLGNGENSRNSFTRRKLLAHELTHVVQQKGASDSNSTIQRLGNPISEADLDSPGERGISTREQTLRRFMREVYKRQVALWAATGATYLHEVPPGDLVTLPGSYAIPGRTIEVHKDIQSPVTNMINDARTALSSAGGAAAGISNVGIRSGYRSAASQFSIWTTWAPQYYRRTRSDRRDSTRFPAGEHSDAAAQYLAEYTNQRVFSPGYSPHQHGRTVDVSFQDATGWAPADTTPAWISRWTSSWFFGWLQQNASRYGFFQNPNLNEPWHWEFNPLIASILSIIQWLLDLLEPLIGQRRVWLGDERTEDDPPPENPGSSD